MNISPVLQIFEVRMFGITPVTHWLAWLVRARYLRIIPVEFRHYFYLRVEVLGCTGGEECVCWFYCNAWPWFTNPVTSRVDHPGTPSLPTSSSSGPKVPVQPCGSGQFACARSEECVSVSVLCDGRADCKDHSDEANCGESSTHWFNMNQSSTLAVPNLSTPLTIFMSDSTFREWPLRCGK